MNEESFPQREKKLWNRILGTKRITWKPTNEQCISYISAGSKLTLKVRIQVVDKNWCVKCLIFIMIIQSSECQR